MLNNITNGWVTMVIGGLMIVAITGAVIGYGDDREQDTQIEALTELVKYHEESIRTFHASKIITEKDITQIQLDIGEIKEAIVKIADKQ